MNAASPAGKESWPLPATVVATGTPAPMARATVNDHLAPLSALFC
ncbi:hypothetical protein [Sphaerisporangium rhizosphaerae]|uniref:Uncharacterized protein n=1 Tax=Sphaerisporangium rhizosphaerae TaxID=2269375 RepID=A0ABW2PGN9_9ACTN